eukprot:3987804-Pleurochrysis_carterae.AAC.1
MAKVFTGKSNKAQFFLAILTCGEDGGKEQMSPYWSSFSSTSPPLGSSRTGSWAWEAATPGRPPGSGARTTPHNVRRCFNTLLQKPFYCLFFNLPNPNYGTLGFLNSVSSSSTPPILGFNLILALSENSRPTKAEILQKKTFEISTSGGCFLKMESAKSRTKRQPCPRPPHNGYKIRLSASGFEHFVISRGLNI